MEPAKHFTGAQIASNTQQQHTQQYKTTPHTAVLAYNVSKVSIKNKMGWAKNDSGHNYLECRASALQEITSTHSKTLIARKIVREEKPK